MRIFSFRTFAFFKKKKCVFFFKLNFCGTTIHNSFATLCVFCSNLGNKYPKYVKQNTTANVNHSASICPMFSLFVLCVCVCVCVFFCFFFFANSCASLIYCVVRQRHQTLHILCCFCDSSMQCILEKKKATANLFVVLREKKQKKKDANLRNLFFCCCFRF